MYMYVWKILTGISFWPCFVVGDAFYVWWENVFLRDEPDGEREISALFACTCLPVTFSAPDSTPISRCAPYNVVCH